MFSIHIQYVICMFIFKKAWIYIYVCIHMVLIYRFRTFIYPICKIPLMNPKCLNHPLVTTEDSTHLRCFSAGDERHDVTRFSGAKKGKATRNTKKCGSLWVDINPCELTSKLMNSEGKVIRDFLLPAILCIDNMGSHKKPTSIVSFLSWLKWIFSSWHPYIYIYLG